MPSSDLRFVPVTFGSKGDGDFLSSFFRCEEVLGGVAREDAASGVLERLRLAISDRKRAARLLVETIASA